MKKQSSATFEEINQLIWNYLSERGWDKLKPRDLAVSINLEAAELLEHYQWSDQPVKNKEAADELADILIYCFEYAQAANIDMVSVLKNKLQRSAEKYPVEIFNKSSADHEAYLKIKESYRTNPKIKP